MESKLLKKKLKLKSVEEVFKSPFVIVSLGHFHYLKNDIFKSCRLSSVFFTSFLQKKFPYLQFLPWSNCYFFFLNSFLLVPGVLDVKNFFEIAQVFFSKEKKLFMCIFIFENVISSKTFDFLLHSISYNFSVNIKFFFFRFLSKKISFFLNCIIKS